MSIISFKRQTKRATQHVLEKTQVLFVLADVKFLFLYQPFPYYSFLTTFIIFNNLPFFFIYLSLFYTV